MIEPTITLVIPNYNGSATIARCLEAACASGLAAREIVVVDDCSTDDSIEIIRRYPCTLVRLDRRSGAGAARNAGARKATGDYLFFIDADCLLLDTTLPTARDAVRRQRDAVLGGTYTALPADSDFFSTFQSLFIHYSESRRPEPDYIAGHAMVIRASTFRATGGFPERFLPIIEDVELSHRLRRSGHRLLMVPGLLVRHIFHFTFAKSLRNAFRKSVYWTVYSLHNRDVLADSGTASLGMKINVLSFLACAAVVLHALAAGAGPLLGALPLALGATFLANRGLARACIAAKGWPFSIRAMLYYLFVYPLAVAAGAAGGILLFLRSPRLHGMAGAEP
jgi:GT2 family glycosyltransferase